MIPNNLHSNFDISKEVISPFNSKPSALIYQEVDVVFENKKCDYELQMRLDCKESQKKHVFLAQYAGQLM